MTDREAIFYGAMKAKIDITNESYITESVYGAPVYTIETRCTLFSDVQKYKEFLNEQGLYILQMTENEIQIRGQKDDTKM